MKSLRPRGSLDPLDVSHDRIQRGGHLLMHDIGIVTCDNIRLVPISGEQ